MAATGDRPASTPRARRAIPIVCHSSAISGSSRRAARTPIAKRGERWPAGRAHRPSRSARRSRSPGGRPARWPERRRPRPILTSVSAPIRIGPIATTVGPDCSAANRALTTAIETAAIPTSQARGPEGGQDARDRHEREEGREDDRGGHAVQRCEQVASSTSAARSLATGLARASAARGSGTIGVNNRISAAPRAA